MRRRPPPPRERVWHLDDMPSRLRHFDPTDWGCFTVAQWEPEWQLAKQAWHAEQRRWLVEHGVNVLEELRARMHVHRADWRIRPETTNREERP